MPEQQPSYRTESGAKLEPAPPLTLSEFQAQVSEWSHRNFRPRSPQGIHALLGLQEELGELSHAHLKAAQGIRGTAEEHHAAKIDAVGDLVIYLADYCSDNGIDLGTAIATTWSKVRRRDWTRNKADGTVGEAAG